MQRKKPLVTIGIPTHNRADSYLSNTLRSALAQSHESIEIIVSDNASSDNTEALVRSLSNELVRYIKHNKALTPNDNFNLCLSAAKGDYFLLLHDDDTIDSDFISSCMQATNNSTEFGTIRTGTRVVDAQGSIMSEHLNLLAEDSVNSLVMGWFTGKTAIYMCSTLFNTKKLREIGGFHSQYNLLQDAVAITILAAKSKRIEIPDIKASFRKHPNEATFVAKVASWCNDFFCLLEMIVQLCPENAEIIREQGRRFFSHLCMGRAKAVPSRRERMLAYMTVAKTFGYRHMPQKRLIRELLS